MEGQSNGGLLYHEVQEGKLCAVHCVNTVLQGPFFSEFDLAALAADLDRTERQMMGDAGVGFTSEESHNVSLGGDFSIQVLQKALEVWDLQVIPMDSPIAGPAQIDPELESAFICHLQDHWFTIRKVNGEWYNFDSLYPAPEHLSKFYLAAYLDTLKGSGWSIFLARGNFPKECPLSSAESSNGFGQWLTAEDCKRILKACSTNKNSKEVVSSSSSPALENQELLSGDYASMSEAEMISAMEDRDLKAAIAASLEDSIPVEVASGKEESSNDSSRGSAKSEEPKKI